nr:ribonuclease H-like domain-containing protein [Tanacetum cinerariifolium]
CDSSGDLYPVTPPSPTPHALLSVSPSTWHQRLRHPDKDVLLSLCDHGGEFDNTTFLKYKARLVANGHSQQFGVDCDDTFSPVVKPDTVRMVLSLALSRNWPIHQLDVKNAFLNDDLSETVYMYQPPGFVDSQFPHHVMRTGLVSHRVVVTRHCSYINEEFDMTDLEALNNFLRISVTRGSTSMFLSQRKYALELLDRAHMVKCNLTRTLVDTESKLGYDRDPISDLTLYRIHAGGFQYLTFTCPDISYAAQQVLLLHIPMMIGLVALLPGGLHMDCVFLGDVLLSWSAKRQHTLTRSSAEAECRCVANVVAETAGLRSCSYVLSRYQYADIFTKGLPSALFEKFRTSLSVQSSPAQTARAY